MHSLVSYCSGGHHDILSSVWSMNLTGCVILGIALSGDELPGSDKIYGFHLDVTE